MDSEIVKEVLALLIRSQVLAEELDLPEFKIPQHIVYAGAAVQAIDLLRGHPDGWYAVDLCARSLAGCLGEGAGTFRGPYQRMVRESGRPGTVSCPSWHTSRRPAIYIHLWG